MIASRFARSARSLSMLSPPVPKFDTVACIGLGLMGHGIAQVSAQSGFKVVAFEQEQRFLDSGRSRIEGSLGKMLKREKISQDQYDGIMNGITWTTDFADLATADLHVEAVIENMDLKKQLYGELAAVAKPEVSERSRQARADKSARSNPPRRPPNQLPRPPLLVLTILV